MYIASEETMRKIISTALQNTRMVNLLERPVVSTHMVQCAVTVFHNSIYHSSFTLPQPMHP